MGIVLRRVSVALVISSIVMLRLVLIVPHSAYADGSGVSTTPPSWVTDGNSYVQPSGSNVQMSFSQPTDGSLSSDEIAVIQNATQQYNNDPLVNDGITALLYTDQGQGLTLVPTGSGSGESGDYYVGFLSPIDPNQDPMLSCIEGATVLQVQWWGVSLDMPECLTQALISADQLSSTTIGYLQAGGCTLLSGGIAESIPASVLVGAACGVIMLALSQGLGNGANTLTQVDAACGSVGVSVNVPWPVAGISASMWWASDSAYCSQPTTQPTAAPTPSLVAPPVNPTPPPADNNPTCFFGLCF